MDKFFNEEPFTYAEMIKGMHQGVKDLSLYPVLCGSGVNCLGSLMLMDQIITLLPNPEEGTYLDKSSNGLSYAVEKLKGQALYGHITLSRSERSDLAAIAAKLL